MNQSGNRNRSSLRQAVDALCYCVIVLVVASGCATSESRDESQVVVASLSDSGSVETTGMTYAELEAHVRRFADRYMTRVAVASNTLIAATTTNRQRYFMEEWKTVSYAAVVEVAIGQDAMTNLLDMMTLTMLSRLVVEEFWAPEIMTPAVGEELSDQFLQTYFDLENDIWSVADDVLTEEQQNELRILVREWRDENPEQLYPWYVRLSNFSGQRAASLNAVKESGGMLREVARARETAEEIQAFGERVLFYLQRAPMLTSAQFESSANSLLAGPEVTALVEDVDRFVAAVERLVTVIEALPGGRLTAVDQFMDRVSEERLALIADLSAANPEMQRMLGELLPVLQSLERTIQIAKTKNPDSKPFDINEYNAMVQSSGSTATELRLLTESISELLASGQQMNNLVASMVDIQESMINKLFIRMIWLIVILIVALIGYRYISVRFLPKS